MGMSASQMRLILLTAQKTDTEHQGQQINQQRTSLATESSSIQSQLLNMSVPTPPSTSDFTKTSYSFKDANDNSCTINGTFYQANGTYNINYTTTAIKSKGESRGIANFVGDPINGYQLYNSAAGVLQGNLSFADTSGSTSASLKTIGDLTLICKDCNIPDAAGLHFGDPGYVMPTFMTYNSNPDGSGSPRYVLASEVAANAGSSTTNLGTGVKVYDVNENAEVTSSSQLTNVNITWSDSGRMTSITTPQHDTYPLTANTTTDEKGYQDAMSEYGYKQSVYNKQMNDLNTKSKQIQINDSKLERELSECDTKQKALSTEMESVKSIISANIKNSYGSLKASG